jgi:hypothetical protein
VFGEDLPNLSALITGIRRHCLIVVDVETGKSELSPRRPWALSSQAKTFDAGMPQLLESLLILDHRLFEGKLLVLLHLSVF